MKKKIVYPLIAFVTVLIFHAVYSIWRGIQISKQWVQVEHSNFLSLYLQRQDYLLSLSYALATAFTVYAILRFLENRRKGITGIVGGLTLTGVLYFAGCFLLGCCGSPMLAVYMSLFGSSFLGLTKPFTLILTMASVVGGYFWMEKKTKTANSCCAGNERCNKNIIPQENPIEKTQSELQKGMSLAKCRKCGCMKDALENLLHATPLLEARTGLSENIEPWLKQMEPIKYACLGCKHCFPAVAMNAFNQAFPEADTQSLSCGFEINEQTWPPVPGEYFSLCEGKDCPVAVSTLASVELAETLANIKPRELCIVGKTETENIGVDKVIKNIITNPAIRFLILAGKEPEGHRTGSTFLALSQNGVDENMKVIGSAGKRPILKNVTQNEVEAFRKQVLVIDMIGCEDEAKIVEMIKELSQVSVPLCGCDSCTDNPKPAQISNVSIVKAKQPVRTEMDKAGYFVILPQSEKNVILVEHYSYDNLLLRIIEGSDTRSIYWTIIENGWVTQLSHVAYLGKELEKAELSIKFGFKFVQDGA